MSCANTEEYHRGELKAALDPAHPGHLLPPPVPIGCRILDVGCGAGQTMIAAYPDRVSYGIDIDEGALRLGTTLTTRVRFCCGRAEQLPFRTGAFDFVVARVSLVYSDMFRSLREVHRVLRPGAPLWMTLHPISVPWRQARRSNIKGWIFFAYVLLNSAAFHFTGRQFALSGRFESFQTQRGIRRALASAGFADVQVSMGRHFVVTAVRK